MLLVPSPLQSNGVWKKVHMRLCLLLLLFVTSSHQKCSEREVEVTVCPSQECIEYDCTTGLDEYGGYMFEDRNHECEHTRSAPCKESEKVARCFCSHAYIRDGPLGVCIPRSTCSACQYSQWSPWSKCMGKVSCEKEIRTRTRSVSAKAVHESYVCDVSGLTEKKNCCEQKVEKVAKVGGANANGENTKESGEKTNGTAKQTTARATNPDGENTGNNANAEKTNEIAKVRNATKTKAKGKECSERELEVTVCPSQRCIEYDCATGLDDYGGFMFEDHNHECEKTSIRNVPCKESDKMTHCFCSSTYIRQEPHGVCIPRSTCSDCQYSQWSPWSKCMGKVSCEKETRTRTRTVSAKAGYESYVCDVSGLTEQKDCCEPVVETDAKLEGQESETLTSIKAEKGTETKSNLEKTTNELEETGNKVSGREPIEKIKENNSEIKPSDLGFGVDPKGKVKDTTNENGDNSNEEKSDESGKVYGATANGESAGGAYADGGKSTGSGKDSDVGGANANGENGKGGNANGKKLAGSGKDSSLGGADAKDENAGGNVNVKSTDGSAKDSNQNQATEATTTRGFKNQYIPDKQQKQQMRTEEKSDGSSKGSNVGGANANDKNGGANANRENSNGSGKDSNVGGANANNENVGGNANGENTKGGNGNGEKSAVSGKDSSVGGANANGETSGGNGESKDESAKDKNKNQPTEPPKRRFKSQHTPTAHHIQNKNISKITNDENQNSTSASNTEKNDSKSSHKSKEEPSKNSINGEKPPNNETANVATEKAVSGGIIKGKIKEISLGKGSKGDYYIHISHFPFNRDRSKFNIYVCIHLFDVPTQECTEVKESFQRKVPKKTSFVIRVVSTHYNDEVCGYFPALNHPPLFRTFLFDENRPELGLISHDIDEEKGSDIPCTDIQPALAYEYY